MMSTSSPVRTAGRPAARPLLAGLACALLAACTASPPPARMAEVGEYYRPGSGYALGYLHRGADVQVAQQDYPDSLRFVGPPPAPGSLLQRIDEAAYQQGKALRQSPRGALAVADADLKSPQAVQAFACTLGVNISAERTPHLDMLLRRSLNDAGLATFRAKDHYARQRPFRQHAEASCTPADEARLKNDSYPSGHAAIGMAWGLALAQVAPERTEALVARGLAYGDSRWICGVHWRSDVQAGQLAGAAAFARLQSEPLYLRQLALARQEVAAARQRGDAPAPAACAAEDAALRSLTHAPGTTS